MEIREAKRHVSVFCLCGGSMSGWVSPPGVADPVKAEWLSIHKGEGHGPATAEQARNARRREYSRDA